MGGNFYCGNTKIINLIGSPRYVGNNFFCNSNSFLISLKGAPEFVGEDFHGRNNKNLNVTVEEIKELQKQVQGRIFIDRPENFIEFFISLNKNKIQESDEDFGDVSEFPKSTYWTNKIFKILQERKINYVINPETGLIDVSGDVDLSDCSLESLGGIGFGAVSGYFDCSYNLLTTLEGAPKSVGIFFSCNNNQLITLEGAPDTVGGGFYCHNNRLTTLEGAPEFVGGGFYCHRNQLTTLEGAPEFVDIDFYCNDNRLTTLEGAPKSVGGRFLCNSNLLTTLEGAPESIGGHFYCDNNPLTTLGDIKQRVRGKIVMSN